MMVVIHVMAWFPTLLKIYPHMKSFLLRILSLVIDFQNYEDAKKKKL